MFKEFSNIIITSRTGHGNRRLVKNMCHVRIRLHNKSQKPTKMAFSNTTAYKNLMRLRTPTQIEYYVKNNASDEILGLVPLSNKAFGEGMQRIVSELFGLSAPTNTGHDATYKDCNIEVKAARYWAGKTNCKWQHIMSGHNYKWVMFVLVDFQDLKFWLISKDVIDAHPSIFTQQGNAEGQGRWCTMKNVLPLAHRVESREDLDRVIFG